MTGCGLHMYKILYSFHYFEYNLHCKPIRVLKQPVTAIVDQKILVVLGGELAVPCTRNPLSGVEFLPEGL